MGVNSAESAPFLTVHSKDGVRRLVVHPGASIRDVLDTTSLRVRAACGGSGTCGACVIRLLSGQVTPPTLAENLKLRHDGLDLGLRLACQVRLKGNAEIQIDDPAPVSPWRSLPTETLLSVSQPPMDVTTHVLALAIDLGTTHIRISLWDRKNGRRIASRMGTNPQASFGADVLNRLDAALQSQAHAQEIASLAREAILSALRDILARDVGEVSPMLKEIGEVMIVGNTAMLALLTGQGATELMKPENWLSAIDCQPLETPDWRAAWKMQNARFHVLAPMTGFVGSDLLADVIAARCLDDPPGTLLIDVGTNTEIALWDGEWLRVTSVPGGPSFEGAGIPNGMAAEEGAIYRVEADAASNSFLCRTIGGVEARGYCGSGLLDGIALLRKTGILKPSGRFAQVHEHEMIVGNSHSAISGIAVDAFQRAKAATAAAVETLLLASGMKDTQLNRIVICGAFGSYLNVANAQAVGFLPQAANAGFELRVNAALEGCERLLLSPCADQLITSVLLRTQPMNLAMMEGYEDRFISHLRLVPMKKDCGPKND